MKASRDHAPPTFAATCLRTLPPAFDQFSGDLLCPLCERPMDVLYERTEFGTQPVGRCADCISTVDLA